MHLSKLNLINFKNHTDLEIEFNSHINIICGLNGSGKTNVLDAIYYLSLCKSYFNISDAGLINKDTDFFMINGHYKDAESTDQVHFSLKKNQKKIVKRNQKEYEKLSDHIGFAPLVMISPNDHVLINDGSEVRRKFIDSVIAQYDSIYLNNLLLYNRALQQRNTLLKFFAEQNKFDPLSLDIWTQQLIKYGEYLYSIRTKFIEEFSSLFYEIYEIIAGKFEQISIVYDSSLQKSNYAVLMDNNLQKDRFAGITTAGIHKDDLLFSLIDNPLKKIGSQGQQKTFLLALKLAQYQLLKKYNKKTPILLLDDIYDKLDEIRVAKLLKYVCSNSCGQVFITHTQANYLIDDIEKLNITYKLVNL